MNEQVNTGVPSNGTNVPKAAIPEFLKRKDGQPVQEGTQVEATSEGKKANQGGDSEGTGEPQRPL